MTRDVDILQLCKQLNVHIIMFLRLESIIPPEILVRKSLGATPN